MGTGRILQQLHAGSAQITELNLHRTSGAELSSPGSADLYPLLVRDDGSWTASRVLSWRLNVEGVPNAVHSAQFWFEQVTIAQGWDVRVAIGAQQSPVDLLPGVSVETFMQPVDIDNPAGVFNLMPGYTTANPGVGDNTPTPGATFNSPYVHLWAQANQDSPAGVLDPDGLAVQFAWIEI